MIYVQVFLIAIGLSMDAFAVSMCKGLGMKQLNQKHALIIALFFGGFQALMPLVGWFFGTQFDRYIQSVDHWIAFGLLVFIGGKMLLDAIREEGVQEFKRNESGLDIKELILLAIATSIDALAAGITLAVLKTPILPAILLIGLTTLLLCWIGVSVGFRFGSKYEKAAQITGGMVLVLLGVKILFEHLGLVSFPF